MPSYFYYGGLNTQCMVDLIPTPMVDLIPIYEINYKNCSIVDFLCYNDHNKMEEYLE